MDIENLISDTMATWRQERPDIDFTAMSIALKLNAVHRSASNEIQIQLETLGLTIGEFDVLAILRRHGKGALLTPSEIAAVAIVSQSGLTHRLAQLEKMGCIARQHDPNDRRSALIRLTAHGRKIADKGIEIAVAVQTRVCMIVSESERLQFESVLDQLLKRIDAKTLI